LTCAQLAGARQEDAELLTSIGDGGKVAGATSAMKRCASVNVIHRKEQIR
jgi:hypothetical protein